MADSFDQFCQTFDSFFRQDDDPAPRQTNVTDDEKPVNKTADLTQETTSSSFMCDPSTSFTSWLPSPDFDKCHIVVPSLQPDSPHILGLDADDDTELSEELRHNDGTSPEETYDGSKPFAEWLSSRDAENVVATPSSQLHGKAQFGGLMFQSAHDQYDGGTNRNISQDDSNRACYETNNAFPVTMLNDVCYGNGVAKIISETCGCTIITQLNDLLDTRHCDGDVQDVNADNHHHNQDELIGVAEAVEAIEAPLDIEVHDIRCDGNEEEEEEVYATEREREDMEEICLNDSFDASPDIHGNNYGKETNQSDKLGNDNCTLITPEKPFNDGIDELSAPEEDFPLDETPRKSLDDHLDDAPRKKLSEMLLDSSLFQPNSNDWSSGFEPSHNEWSSGLQPTNDAWGSGCSIDGDDINTVDLESLDDALNDRDEIFRDTLPKAPPQVHLLAPSLAASSASSDHGSIFERVFHEQNRAQRREDNHSRRSTSRDEESKGSKPKINSRIEDHHSRLSSVSSKGRGQQGYSTNSQREDVHSRRSSVSRGEEEEPKTGKENTIIVMSIKSRRGKDKYARHARMQRLASKVARQQP